ncbi:cell wall-associated NlpC family hydrolase [Paenibacillus taihuensis]|uniref:Cell wall-associated NlpC family hydrolase n=1 Tax=Paenibacillus taihuensis TaxID=1156355 RepID=A0A3D9S713_9BACL|nr:SH3 domain-containing C40 family peptidase [Paenibacillus taihuensis]REE88980.1 cell wall-associated NlpC family hydrolase [Paenibacillus taihuensis]
MKKTLISIIAGCTLLAGASSAFAATTTVQKTVNFRTAPSTSSSTYGFIQSGTQLTVLEKVNTYWLKVQSGSKVGYVSTNYVGAVSGSTSTSNTTSSSKTATGTASKIVSTAKTYLGDFTYKWGSEPWNTSYKYSDCSSFVQLVFNKKNGFSLPRSSIQQSKVGSFVSKSSLKAGDLVFFDTNGDGVINHVGIYIGSGQFIHSSPTNHVGTNTLTSGYWSSHYKTARRVI